MPLSSQAHSPAGHRTDLAGEHIQAPVRPPASIDRVYEHLRDQITTGKLAPGVRVDQQRIAHELGCSRMPVRQAIVRLSAEALVVTTPHAGARVSDLSLSHLVEIYSTRAALEAMLATEGAKRCDRAQIARLRDLLAGQQRAAADRDISAFVALDRDFHRTLYLPSNYGFACSLVEQLRELSLRYLYASAKSEAHIYDSIDGHQAILDAILAQDYKLVATLTKRHIDEGADVLVSSMNYGNSFSTGRTVPGSRHSAG